MKPEMEKWRETVKFRRQAGTRPVCLDQKVYKFQSSPLPLPQSTGGIWEDRKDILQVLSSPKARACDAREDEIINCCGHWDKLFWTVKNRLPWTERLLTMLRDFFFFYFWWGWEGWWLKTKSWEPWKNRRQSEYSDLKGRRPPQQGNKLGRRGEVGRRETSRKSAWSVWGLRYLWIY